MAGIPSSSTAQRELPSIGKSSNSSNLGVFTAKHVLAPQFSLCHVPVQQGVQTAVLKL
jgi:hypothetical protein